MSREFENILQNKLADAEINSFSMSKKAELWANISTQTAAKTAIGSTSAQSAIVTSKSGSLISLKLGILIKSKIFILSFVCASAISGYFLVSSSEASDSPKEISVNKKPNQNTIQTHTIISPESKEISDDKNTQNQVFNSDKKNHSISTIQEPIPITTSLEENEKPQDLVVENQENPILEESIVPVENIIIAEPQSENTVAQASDSVNQKKEAIVVKKTVVIENKEVKIVKKKSKYSK